MTKKQERQMLHNYISKKYFYGDLINNINERNFGEKPKYDEEVQ